jgi:hypothetical protein
MQTSPITHIPLRATAWLAAGLLGASTLASPLAAQTSDAATASAFVVVLAEGISVTTVSDLLFGEHFPSSGIVANENPAVWNVVTDNAPAIVDITVTQLPATLSSATGNEVPLTYGSHSFAVACTEGFVQADPSVGVLDCELAGATPGNVALGNQFGIFPGDESVEVDLTGAPAGTYTATLEVTATLD